eukprot:g25874.t1
MINPQQDVICEIPYQHIGDRGGRCYFTLSDKTMAFLKQVKEGDVNPLTVFLAQEKKPLKDGKESKQSKEGKDGLEAVKNTENVGFSIMDFPKGQVGQRNLQAFFRQLPGVYEKRGIKLLKEDATIRVNKKLHTWAPLTVQLLGRSRDGVVRNYELRWWPWSLEGETSVGIASTKLAAAEVAAGDDCDDCYYPLPLHASRCSGPSFLEASRPTASWVAVRACNEEGWAEWSRASLIFLQEVIGEEEGDKVWGSLLTWGASEDGRLGKGLEALDRPACPELSPVPGFEDVTSPQDCRLSCVAVGAHTAVLTSSDRLFLWGSFLPTDDTEDEECCKGDETARELFVDMLLEPQEQALDFVPHRVSCGRFCTAVLSAEGSCFVWGPNEAYQCGLPEDSLVKSLTRLKVPKEEPLVQVEFGEFHGVGLTASGHVLRWGQEQGPDVPLARQALDDPKTLKFVAAGGYHSALVTTCGQLYLWGSNSYGQLGLGLKRDELAFVGQPRPVDVEGALSVGDVSHASPVVAGVSLGGLHSAFLDVQGAVYTFGDNRRGQCGQGEVTQLSAPERLQDRPADFGRDLSRSLPRADGVSCGGFFSFFQVADDLYACGWGKEGCLGFGQLCKKQLRVRRVPPPQRGFLG